MGNSQGKLWLASCHDEKADPKKITENFKKSLSNPFCRRDVINAIQTLETAVLEGKFTSQEDIAKAFSECFKLLADRNIVEEKKLLLGAVKRCVLENKLSSQHDIGYIFKTACRALRPMQFEYISDAPKTLLGVINECVEKGKLNDDNALFFAFSDYSTEFDKSAELSRNVRESVANLVECGKLKGEELITSVFGVFARNAKSLENKQEKYAALGDCYAKIGEFMEKGLLSDLREIPQVFGRVASTLPDEEQRKLRLHDNKFENWLQKKVGKEKIEEVCDSSKEENRDANLKNVDCQGICRTFQDDSFEIFSRGQGGQERRAENLLDRFNKFVGGIIARLEDGSIKEQAINPEAIHPHDIRNTFIAFSKDFATFPEFSSKLRKSLGDHVRNKKFTDQNSFTQVYCELANNARFLRDPKQQAEALRDCYEAVGEHIKQGELTNLQEICGTFRTFAEDIGNFPNPDVKRGLAVCEGIFEDYLADKKLKRSEIAEVNKTLSFFRGAALLPLHPSQASASLQR